MERFNQIIEEINALADQSGPKKIEKLNSLEKEARKILQDKNTLLYSVRENALNGKKIME